MDVREIAAKLTKAQREALPKARILSIRWAGWRYAGFYRNRCANFCRQMIGPFVVCWRRPWLPHVARRLHPEVFAVRAALLESKTP